MPTSNERKMLSSNEALKELIFGYVRRGWWINSQHDVPVLMASLVHIDTLFLKLQSGLMDQH